MTAAPAIPFDPPEHTVGGWLPSNAQKALLRACLLTAPDAANAAFQDWLKRMNGRRFDAASWRLLPALAHNLGQLGIDHPILADIEPIHRYIWLRNKIHLNRAAQAFDTLTANGNPCIALKGVSLLLRCHDDLGLRSMEDVDVLIPTENAWDTVRFLTEQGWQAPFIKSQLDQDWLASHHSLNFIGPDDTRLDLHWHIFPERVEPGADAGFWQDAVPLDLCGAKALALDWTDELLTACIHGICWERVPPIRWIADAHAILRAADKIDWNRLLARGESLRLLLPLRAALNLLHFDYSVPIPVETLRRLNAHRPDASERLQFLRKIYSDDDATLLDALRLHGQRYRVCVEDWPEFKGPIGFCRYLQREWQLDDWRAVPFVGAGKVARRAARTARNLILPQDRQSSPE